MANYKYTNDSNGNITSELFEAWVNLNWVLSDPWERIGFEYIDSYYNHYNFYGATGEIFYKTITSINKNELSILDFSLSQNYPNPFKPNTTIKYSITQKSYVSLKIYDLFGSEIIKLVNDEKSAGNYEIDFEGKNLTSGIYFYRMHAGDFVETKKMICLK